MIKNNFLTFYAHKEFYSEHVPDVAVLTLEFFVHFRDWFPVQCSDHATWQRVRAISLASVCQLARSGRACFSRPQVLGGRSDELDGLNTTLEFDPSSEQWVRRPADLAVVRYAQALRGAPQQ